MMDMKFELPFSDTLPCGVCSFEDVGALLDCRAKQRIPQDAKSVIVYLFPYWLGEEFYENSNISKYSVPADYHLIAGEYLKKIAEVFKKDYPHNKFECFCDNSPLNEVRAAILCGLGVKGRNGLLINEKYGSFCFVGEIVTDLKIKYDCSVKKDCLECGACEKACPAKAISEKGVDRNLCLSNVTQRKGELSEEEVSLIKKTKCIWGCDVCQNVCPMNKNIPGTPIKEFSDSAVSVYEKGASLDGRAYNWRGRKVIERNLEYIK